MIDVYFFLYSRIVSCSCSAGPDDRGALHLYWTHASHWLFHVNDSLRLKRRYVSIRFFIIQQICRFSAYVCSKRLRLEFHTFIARQFVLVKTTPWSSQFTLEEKTFIIQDFVMQQKYSSYQSAFAFIHFMKEKQNLLVPQKSL